MAGRFAHRPTRRTGCAAYIHTRYEKPDGRSQASYAIQFSKCSTSASATATGQSTGKRTSGRNSLAPCHPARRRAGEYNLIQYRFLNGPVVDGDAFNDGTWNFYMLVKLESSENDGSTLPQRYAILWIDEQTYFTQRWRLLHPTEDVLGDLFSLAHTIKDNPTWFPYSDTEFWNTRFWSPFADDLITDVWMAVRRQIVAVTGYDRKKGATKSIRSASTTGCPTTLAMAAVSSR